MVFENCTKTSCRHRQVRAQFYGIFLLLDLLSKFIAPITEQEEEGSVERIHCPPNVNFFFMSCFGWVGISGVFKVQNACSSTPICNVMFNSLGMYLVKEKM